MIDQGEQVYDPPLHGRGYLLRGQVGAGQEHLPGGCHGQGCRQGGEKEAEVGRPPGDPHLHAQAGSLPGEDQAEHEK